MCSTAAIGIDLGTTFSCVAVFQKGRPEIIKVQGQRTVPSTVFYHHLEQDVAVGGDAQDEADLCHSNEIFDVKRLIGRKFKDSYVDQLVKTGRYPFALCPFDDGVAIEIKYKGNILRKKPEMVCSELIRALKESATEYLGVEVTEAVVSVPAYFSNAQRKATMRAAEIAGLKVLRFISEPVAAAVQYTYGENIDDRTLLVFDFGGGTLDVSIIRVTGKLYSVKAVHGDTALGGRDIDAILMTHFSHMHGGVPSHTLIKNLRENCIKLKKKLSFCHSPNKEATVSFTHNEQHYSLKMSRKTFDELNRDIYERAIDVVALCLYKADLDKTAIDEVVLVGGSCKILKVQELLQDFFPGKILRKDVDPDEAIAMGACIQAAILKKNDECLEEYSIREVTPLSVGYSTYGGVMKVFIPRNTQLPTTRSELIATTHNDQTVATLEIFEGERSQVRYNNKLGRLSIEEVPKGKAGTIKFDIIFNLNEDGILEISASEKSTGKTESLVVTMGNFQLCEYQANKSLREAQENQADDNIFLNFMAYRNLKLNFFNTVMYDVENILVEKNRKLLKTACRQFIATIQNIDYHNFNELVAKFNIFCQRFNIFVERYPGFFQGVEQITLR